MNGQLVRELSTRGDTGAVGLHLSAISELGVDFVRANTDWVSLEPVAPGPGGASYDFSTHDRWVEALATRDLRWQPTGIGITTPPWARAPAVEAECGDRSPPQPEAFAEMMAALAGRYGAGGSFWAEHPDLPRLPVQEFEVWNEPNFSAFWCPAPDPEGYAEVALAAARAIHDADPEARVVLGGLAGFSSGQSPLEGSAISPERFVAGMLESEPQLREELDVVGLHIYESDPEAVVQRLAAITAAMDDVLPLPVALSEVGWPTSGQGAVPEELRVEYLDRVPSLVAGEACRVESLAPHTWITAELDPGNAEDWFGLADPVTGVPYPSAGAYASAIDELGGSDSRDAETFVADPCEPG